MDEQATWDQLERLGLARRGHFEAGEQHVEYALESLEPLADPRTANELAERLGGALSEPPADVVVAWAGLPSILFGFLVGVALDRRVLRLADDEGLVFASAELERGQRAVLVGDRLSERDVRLARAYVESKGATLGQIGALVDEGHVPGVVALVSLRSHRHAPEQCPSCRQNLPLQQRSNAVATR